MTFLLAKPLSDFKPKLLSKFCEHYVENNKLELKFLF